MEAIWIFITWACLVWYSTITIFVAIKGYADIKTMLKNLSAGNRPEH